MAITNRHKNKDLPSQKEWQERTRQRIRDAGTVEKGLQVLDGELTLNAGQLQVLKMFLPTILPTQSESSVEQVTPVAPDMASLKVMLHGNLELLDALGLMVKPEVKVVDVKPVEITQEMRDAPGVAFTH